MGTAGEPGFHRVRVGRAEVLVTRLPSGEAVAFAADCPHQQTPLDAATFWDGKLRCGRHQYLYDVHTGANVLPARDAPPEAMHKLKPGYLPIHPVEERDGWIWVADAPEPPPATYDPELERSPRTPPPPSPPTAPAAPSGPVDGGTETRRVRVGEEFELVLPTTPRPAHMWRVSVASGGVAVVSEAFAPDAPPRHVARLVARVGGDAEVRCTYATPWAQEPAETRRFLVRVDP